MSSLPREKGPAERNSEHAQITIPGATHRVTIAPAATWDSTALAEDTTWVMLDIEGEVIAKRSDRMEDAGFPLRVGGVYSKGIPEGALLVLVNEGSADAIVNVMEAGA
jgi:hypothetical protein